jgi:hypothetical protein
MLAYESNIGAKVLQDTLCITHPLPKTVNYTIIEPTCLVHMRSTALLTEDLAKSLPRSQYKLSTACICRTHLLMTNPCRISTLSLLRMAASYLGYYCGHTPHKCAIEI